MKRLALGTLLGFVLVVSSIALGQQHGDLPGSRPEPAHTSAPLAQTAELIVVPTALGEKTQMLTVIDPRQKVLCVYHIDLATGKIALRSVRNIHWDLQMTYLNNESPLPQEIQSLLEQR